MLGASLYILACSARNRLRLRLRRLREPRYLLGAIVGVAYLYFRFFARIRASRSTSRRRAAAGGASAAALLATMRGGASTIGGLALLAVAMLTWIVPATSGLLDFSEAETQFLFPAPVSRRALLLHRMLRSQLGILFGSIVVGLTAPTAAGLARLRTSVAMWLLLSAAKIYSTGVSLARARLTAPGGRARRVAWTPLLVMGAAFAVAAVPVVRALVIEPASGLRDALQRVGAAGSSGAAAVALWPFAVLVRPMFSPWPGPYFEALAQGALVLAACVLWVLSTDAAFQDAAAGVAARRLEARTTGAATRYRPRATAWRLSPSGRAEGAFAWKAALQTVRVVDKRTILRVTAIVWVLTIAAISVGRGNGFAAILASMAIGGAIFAVFIGPQTLRMDLRQDLRHLELLKTWPVRGSAVIRGELAWPGLVMTAIAWTATLVALPLSGSLLARTALHLRVAGAAAFAILAPALVFAQFAIHNGVALMFPAWVPLGNQRARGIDALGQRLILLGGTWLMLILTVIPGAIPAAIVWFVLHPVAGSAAYVPAAVVCATVIAVEVIVATELLGPLYERLDLLAVERVE